MKPSDVYWRIALGSLLFALSVACSGSGVAPGAVDSTMSREGVVFVDGQARLEMSVPGLTITPINPTITISSGTTPPKLDFTAWLDGKEVLARWTLEQGAYGAMATDGVFTPSGKVAGAVKVEATVGGLTASTLITIQLELAQNGATADNGNPGPGGFGGVGGEGLGPALTDDQVKALDGAGSSGAVKLLYPYDKTVWPLGLLAPLIQWSTPPKGSGQGVQITLTATNFRYKGNFGRPAALPATAAFVRHPIPQDVWKAATRSAAGGTLELTIKLLSDGTVHGPITQSWTIAAGQLRGTVYYQSYGTNLAKNYDGAKGGDGRFGGATLAIRGSSADPVLVAGKDGGRKACRVCHSVSADGNRMVVQHGDNYQASSAYDLLNGYAEKPYSAATNGRLGWIGMTRDGALGLSNAAPISGGANQVNTGLYDMVSESALATTGLTSFVTKAGFPMFSPDDKLVAFVLYRGAGNSATGAGDSTQLVTMDFDRANRTFANPQLLHRGTLKNRPGWPAFWPTSQAVLFQAELPGADEYFATRYGGRGDLHWVDLATKTVHPLHRLNGKENGVPYLPVGPNSHDDDSVLNYEPTISPVASGGYAWVVFVSRRMYGNVATINPWASDPREHDLTQTPTTKKLWVAALDLDPKPGTDPSHPAFYLPGQELLAGNSRGFWVNDPCKAEGATCEGGDECCGGYCSRSADSGELVCGQTSSGCAQEHDRCERDEDCCDFPVYQCVNQRCALWRVK